MAYHAGFDTRRGFLATLLETVESNAERLERACLAFGHGTDNARDEAAALVLHALGLPPDGAGADLQRELSMEEERAVRRLVERRIREALPAPYLTGRTSFAGLAFRVDRRALVPRSPIAELITQGFEPWVRSDHLHRVLDLCTGGGCIAVATAVHLPGVRVDATDLSAEALDLARENVELHEVEDRVRLLQSDLFEAMQGERYDLVVSNPPYVGREEYESLPAEYRSEPDLALRGGDTGLDLVLRIVAEAPEHLEPGGVLLCEVGNSRAVLQESLPGIPFTWLEFRDGGHGVFLLEGDDLPRAAAAAREVMAGKGA